MISVSKLSALVLIAAAAPSQSFQTAHHRISSSTSLSGAPVQFAPRPVIRASKLMAVQIDSESGQAVDEEQKLPINKPNANVQNNFLYQLSKLRPLLLSLTIFLLPFFLSMPSWAVQSGGRIGGSVGGGNRSNGGYSRSYTSGGGGYSRGFSRGYTSGYYSRPSVVVSPGITPYYR